MKIRKPEYYDSFQCIGSACRDTCCAGWEIEIDEESAERYKRVTGELGERLRASITETEEEIYFNLQAGRRCPFLNKENLCDLILDQGEEILCEICREHPRHYQWFGDYTEVGLGLCCEEAARLLFRTKGKLTFILEEEQEESDENLEELLVKDQAGNALKKEPFYLPKTLTAGTETYPVEYRQGVWKVTVPANCKTLQIIVPDQKENEELSFTKWGGYLTESDKHWYLCPDDPIQDAYTTQGNTYTIDLEKFTLSMEEITREQLAVYGDLAEDITYAEILLTGEGRSELLLVEFATEAMTEEATEAETDAENIDLQKVLFRTGFIRNGKMGEEGPRFVYGGKKGMKKYTKGH